MEKKKIIDFESFEKLNKEKWDFRSMNFDTGAYDYFRVYQRKVVDVAALKSGDFVLDIGCGTGELVLYAGLKIGKNGKSFGIDISPKMIEKAKEKSADNTFFMEANAQALPFKNEYFNHVICTNAFHHFYDPIKSLNEINRVLKEGGKFYLLDLSNDGIIMKIINKHLQKKEKEHNSFYSTEEIVLLFDFTNFRYISTKRIPWILSPLKLHIGEKK